MNISVVTHDKCSGQLKGKEHGSGPSVNALFVCTYSNETAKPESNVSPSNNHLNTISYILVERIIFAKAACSKYQ